MPHFLHPDVPTIMSTQIANFSQHGRFALAFAQLAVHTDNVQEGVEPTVEDTHDYVEDILNESANEWNAFLNYPFPYDMAKAATALDGFRHYMIQDATHFEYFYRARMEALPKSGTFQELNDFARILPGGLAAVQSGRDDCTSQLGVPKEVVSQEPDSSELKEFIKLVSTVSKEGDYLDSIIALLPGVLGYDLITKKLDRDPNTVRNTVYYTLLIQPWSKIPAMMHKKYINSHIANLPEEERKARWGGWVSNFKKGCEYETHFSSLASTGNFPAYNVVNDGFYTIRSYLQNNPYLVPGSSDSVVTSQTVPQEETLWKLTNSPYGYIIQKVGRDNIQNSKDSFLSTAVKEPLQPVYGVSVSVADYRWSINPVRVRGPHGFFSTYQLLVPGTLQYVLDAGNSKSDPKVFVTNNAHISSQFWLLDRVDNVQ